jgi:hypothetical protein
MEVLSLSVNSKRMIFHLYNPEIIQFINSLPRGYRSLVVESALMTYIETDAGRTLVNQLQYRKKDRGKIVPTDRQHKVENVLHKLKGDFD